MEDASKVKAGNAGNYGGEGDGKGAGQDPGSETASEAKGEGGEAGRGKKDDSRMSTPSKSRLSTPAVPPPDVTPDKKEEMRQRLSLFSHVEKKHSLKLAQQSNQLSAVLKVRSMCAFSSRGDGGTPIAIIVDQFREYDNRTILRMAEVCVEYLIVVVRPNESREDAEEGGVHSELRLLTPGGPMIKTAAAPIVIAAVELLLQEAPSMPEFAPLEEGGTAVISTESTVAPSWKDTFEVRIDEDGSIWQQLPTPKLLKLVPVNLVCEALNINMLSLQTDFPIQIVQSVGKHIIVPLRSRKIIHDLDPLFDLICDVCRAQGCDGFHVFSMDPVAGGHLHTRNLSPLVLMEEEPASGSANAALVAYMHFHRIIPIDEGDMIICEQGYAFGMKPRPSKISVQLFFDPVDPAPVIETDTGLTSQNQWVGEAVGDEVTRERIMAKGDRYTSNITDQSRFALPDVYYEEREAEERQRKFKMERAKRQGLVYKEEVKPHVSTAFIPPSIALPSPIASCWVGGTSVPSTRTDYDIKI